MSGAQLRWWHGLGRGQRAAVVVVAVVVAVNLVLAGAQSLIGSAPGGPASSSFSTADPGLEGYADLLRAEGHAVVRLQDRPTAEDLPPTATVVLADPSGLRPTDVRRLAGFLAGGGRLVVAGQQGAPLVAALAGSSIRLQPGEPVERLEVWLAGDSTGSARTIAGDGGGRWTVTGPLLPVAGADGAAAVIVGPVGAGRLLAFADASVLQNANLDRADNAALALAAAGPGDRRVVFVEPTYGDDAAGLAAVPAAWKWAVAGLAVALAAGLWSAGARFGPPEPDRRALRPPRRDHVDAMAANLDRVSGPPTDLAGALAIGEVAARRQQLVHHRTTDPDSPGATS